MHASGVHVEVLRRGTNESSPEEVYRQIQGFCLVNMIIDEDDQLWAVVDRDKVDGENGCLRLTMKCSQNSIF